MVRLNGETALATAVGVMSGTSMDGIDVALIRSDGEARVETGPAATFPYPEGVAQRLRAVVADPRRGGSAAGRPRARRDRRPCRRGRGVSRALRHRPRERRARRAARADHPAPAGVRPDPAALRRRARGAALGLDVVCDFRSADVAAGGEGAPLAPIYHAAMTAGLERPLMVLNWGGVGNVTWLGGEGEIVAFDTGPANALIDDFLLRRRGLAFDAGGALAASGAVDATALAALMQRPLFRPAGAEIARPQPFRRARRGGRALERRGRRGDARRLHRRSDRGRAAPRRRGAEALAGRRRRTPQRLPDAPPRRPARRSGRAGRGDRLRRRRDRGAVFRLSRPALAARPAALAFRPRPAFPRR